MILRQPLMTDYQFVYECYQDWPITVKSGIITIDKVSAWLQRWITRVDEIVRIGEESGIPVGLIHYSRGANGQPETVADVWNIIVHPNHRGLGYSTEIARLAWEAERMNGLELAKFEALPGAIAENIKLGKTVGSGRYHETGVSLGETGQLITGELRPGGL